MIQIREIPMYFFDKTFMDELKLIRDDIQNHPDPDYINSLKAYKNDIREYSVDLIERIKSNEHGAFDELMSLKDMRNFLHHYSFHIRKSFHFNVSEEQAEQEILYEIFLHISMRYRIYNEPHEISLLINSMRGWIMLRVKKTIIQSNLPKQEDEVKFEHFGDCETDDTELVVRDLSERHLNETERYVFERRFFDHMFFEDIAQEMGVTRSTIKRRYDKALDKIKDHMD